MRKNILILGHNYATQFIDIYNQYTRLFDQDKYEVTVAYLTGEEEASVKKRTLATNVIFLNIAKQHIRTLKVPAIKTLLALCKEKKFQTIICHRYKPTYIMLWVAQFIRIPHLIFVMHELYTMSAISRKLLIAALFRQNMLFAGVSNAVRDDIRRHLWRVPKERIQTLYNMIDIEMTEPKLLSREKARQKLNLAQDDFVFGNIARLAPNKDQTSLIKAFAMIKKECPKAKLIIAGDGDLETELKSQAHAYGLTAEIIFTGFLPHASHYMKAFDCFVLSSVQEAFGRVLLEAMLAQCPVIATEVHGIPEVVGQAGTLVKAGDPGALAKAMRELYALSAEERKHLGSKGYQRTMQHFSIPNFAEQFWHLPLFKTQEASL